MVVEAGMLQGFDDTDVSIREFNVFSYDANFCLVLVGRHDLADHILPFLHVAGTVFHVEFLKDNLVHTLFLEQQGHFIDALCRQGLEDSIRIHVAEHGNLFAHFLADFMFTAADKDIRGDADAAQFLDAVLGRFGLQLAGSGNIRDQGDMDIEAVIAGDILLDLANGFQEGFTFNIPYGTANFRNDKISVFFAAYAVDPFLDLVGNVRNDLYRTAQIITAPFLVDDGLVNPTGRNVGVAGQVDIDETFIMAQVKVRLRAVIGDENFAVLIRAHRTRIDIDVGIEFLDRYLIAAALEETAQGRCRDALTQRRNNAARYENILGHVFPPLSVLAIEKLHMVRCGNTENHQTMAQRMTRGRNEGQTGLLEFWIDAQHAALIIERMEKTGKVIDIMGNLMGCPFSCGHFHQIFIVT